MLEFIIFIADTVLVILLVIMTHQLYRALRYQIAPSYVSKMGHDVDLPSVSVCIPARNEQHALADCLQRVVASTYPKLEIIVLDDVSRDNTSALIKSFASEGVRFVEGSQLTDGWLGKNHALQGLLDEASGSYVLFLDVDTILAPSAIENMVRYSLSHRSSMISVLPRREDNWRASVLASPLRYFWEIMFQRKASPATASNAWLIRRDVLVKRFDGLKSFKNSIQPESRIAAELVKTNEYHFLVGTKDFGVAFEKKWRSQLFTGVRIVFPILSNKIPLAFMAMLDLALFLVPFVTLYLVLLWPDITPYLLFLNFLLSISFCILYGAYTHRVWNKGWVVGGFAWPLLIGQEILIVLFSILKYRRRTVKWKGRVIQPEVQS
ncbi:MAG: glycosyltransferase family 2 protein [Candidatus Saccharimonadaceae bacterium]